MRKITDRPLPLFPALFAWADVFRKAMLLALCLTACSPSSEVPFTLLPATKGTLRQLIQVVGDVEARKQVYLAPLFSAKLEKLADDGQFVQKGEEIAKLDIKEIKNELNDKELEWQEARNDLDALLKNAAAELIKLDANVQMAQKNVAIKRLQLRKILEGTPHEELEKLRLNLELTEKALALAKINLEQKKKLQGKGIIPGIDALQAELSLSSKQKDFQIAKQEHALKRAGATALQRQIARLELQQAEERLNIETTNKRFRQERLQLERKKQQAQIDGVFARVTQLQQYKNSASLKAPLTGNVALNKIASMRMLEKPKVGDTVRQGRPFISVANLSEIQVTTEVEEQYISQLRVGLDCSIKVKNMPDQVFPAKVSRIGILATDKKGRAATEGSSKVFEVQMMLTGKHQGIKAGISVDIDIPLKTMNQVLLIPNKAVFREKGQNYVWLADGKKQLIRLGDNDGKQSIVLQGLKSGESIRLLQMEQESSD